MNRALIDTDIYSEIIKAVNPTVAQNASTYRKTHGILTISSITVMEVVKGFQRHQSFQRLQAFLAATAIEEVLEFDRTTAVLAGQIIGELERAGRPIGTADPMIAAIALDHGLELVTGNTAHYQFVQQLGYPLVLANWRI